MTIDSDGTVLSSSGIYSYGVVRLIVDYQPTIFKLNWHHSWISTVVSSFRLTHSLGVDVLGSKIERRSMPFPFGVLNDFQGCCFAIFYVPRPWSFSNCKRAARMSLAHALPASFSPARFHDSLFLDTHCSTVYRDTKIIVECFSLASILPRMPQTGYSLFPFHYSRDTVQSTWPALNVLVQISRDVDYYPPYE